MSDLRLDGVSKAFAGNPALRDVSFHAQGGRVHCLLGGNGSGKSTLVKVLAGVHQADAGTVQVGAATVAASAIGPDWARANGLWFVHQDLAVFPMLSVAENLAAGHDYVTAAGGAIRWRAFHDQARAILERFHLDVDPRTPLMALRPAQRTMVAVARALDASDGATGTIVLDEPTSALPHDEARFLIDAIRRYAAAGHGIVFVTHRLDEVAEVADDVTVLRDGRVVASGPAELGREALAELIVGGRPGAHAPTSAAPAPAGGPPVLELRGPVELTVRAGEVVGLAGRLGSGRSRLLRGIFGAEPRPGEVRVDGDPLPAGDVGAAIAAGIASVPEDRDGEGLFTGLDVRENLSAVDVRRFRSPWGLDRRREAATATQTMRSFLVRAVSDRQPIMTLSGGNRQKVLLARWLRAEPRVLLLDEPTQGVDVGARAEIHRMVRAAVAAGAAAIVVSSDHDELAQLCDRVVVLADGRVAAELGPGDVDAVRISHLTLDAAPVAAGT
jgi:ribose transport system ATP-binding protein